MLTPITENKTKRQSYKDETGNEIFMCSVQASDRMVAVTFEYFNKPYCTENAAEIAALQKAFIKTAQEFIVANGLPAIT